MDPWMYFVAGLATFVAAVSGAIVALRKMGPEVNQIQIDSAQNLVTMAEMNARMSSEQADRLLTQNKILDDRLTEYAQKLGEALHRIEDLEAVASQVDRLRDEVNRLRGLLDQTKQEKQATEQENMLLRDRVTHLEAEIERLDGYGDHNPHQPS